MTAFSGGQGVDKVRRLLIQAYSEIRLNKHGLNSEFTGFSLRAGKWHQSIFLTQTRRGLNNSAYVILLFVSRSILILRFICIILC